MSSKRRFEGEVLIDHRDSPGSNPLLAHSLGVPHVAGGQMLELAAISCNHCSRQMWRNPARERERAHCRKCDRYICDWCKEIAVKTGVCTPVKKVLDEAQEAAFRAAESGSPIILTR